MLLYDSCVFVSYEIVGVDEVVPVAEGIIVYNLFLVLVY